MLTELQKNNRKKLIQRAYAGNCIHIPSALSMLDYFYFLDKKINYKNDALVIGKPYGQLAYHTVWNSIDNKLITGKHDNVIWADTTLGNCLGVACGIALTQKYNNIFINTSDASLQQGTMLEAAQFIGAYKKFKANIILCVDCNKYQCISKNYQTIDDIYAVFKAFKWNTVTIDGHNDVLLQKLSIKSIKPLCILLNTIKGYGIDFMQEDPVNWHYKCLSLNDYNNAMMQLGKR